MLRALVGRTTHELLDLAFKLTEELTPQAESLAIPAMVEAWREPNAKVGLGLPASAVTAPALA